jgi:hypothetical protein
MEDVEKRKPLTLPGLDLRPLGRPALGQSLYRLRSPGFESVVVAGRRETPEIGNRIGTWKDTNCVVWIKIKPTGF